MEQVKEKQKWGERYKHKTLPKNVHPCNINGYSYFRVAKKVKGKVITFGYFKSEDEAVICSGMF